MASYLSATEGVIKQAREQMEETSYYEALRTLHEFATTKKKITVQPSALEKVIVFLYLAKKIRWNILIFA